MRLLSKVKIFGAIIAMSICLFALVPSVIAQEPQPPEVDSTSPQTGTLRVREISWEDLDNNDQTLSVGRSVNRYSFDVPGDVIFGPGSYVNLTVSHTGAQVDKPAALNLSLNGNVVGVAQLTTDNDNRGEIRFDLLPEQLETGSNDIRVSLNTRGDPCNTTDLPVEAVLHKEGFVHLEYETVPREPELRLYPVPFFERSFEPSIIYLVLPDLPTPDDLTVAATISAGLGRYASNSEEVQVNSVSASELTGDIQVNYNLIVIGTPQTNPVLSQLPLPLAMDQENIAPHQGVLQEIRSPWNQNRMILAVTGMTNEGVFKAAAALNRQILFPSLRGQVNIIEALLEPPPEESGLFVVERTFEDLGYRDQVMYGTRANEERFTFNMPGSWQISEPPFLRLHFTHSEILSDTLSSLDVRLNNVPIGSTLLDQNNAKDGLLEVELPVWLLEGGRNQIEVFVDMSLGGLDECVYWSSDQIWTVIGRNSTLRLAYEAQPETFDLANLFNPLTDEPNLADTYLALPSTLNQVERDMFLDLATQLGAATRGNYVSLKAGFVNELSDEIKRDYHIITIGQPSINPLIREINDELPQPFMDSSDEPSQIYNPAIIALDPQRSIGFIQLLASPWNPEKVILVMTGTDTGGTAQALEVLVNTPERLEGNLAVVEEEYLVTLDTRPLQPSPGGQLLKSTAPASSIRMAQAERWW